MPAKSVLRTFALFAAVLVLLCFNETVFADDEEITNEEIIIEETPALESQIEKEPNLISAAEPSLPHKPAKKSIFFLWILVTASLIISVGVWAVIRRKNSGNPPKINIGNTHHIGKRDYQQDCFGISDISNKDLCERKGVFGIVADGMGGMADGGEISSIVSGTMLKYFSETASCGNTGHDLLKMLFAANKNANDFLKGREQGGSTVVAAIIKNGKLYWISVGDSRIYLYRGGGLIRLNREHIYAAELDEKAAAGRISWEEAANDPQRNALTCYIGIGEPEKIDRNMLPVRLIPGDRVLLMSDGVFGVLTDNEILSAQKLKPHKSAEELQRMVLSKNKPNQDNFTAVILEYI